MSHYYDDNTIERAEELCKARKHTKKVKREDLEDKGYNSFDFDANGNCIGGYSDGEEH